MRNMNRNVNDNTKLIDEEHHLINKLSHNYDVTTISKQ